MNSEVDAHKIQLVIDSLMKDYVIPMGKVDPESREYSIRFKVCKCKLANICGSAMSIPLAVQVMNQFPLVEVFKNIHKVSHMVTMAKALLPGGIPAEKLGLGYWNSVKRELTRALKDAGIDDNSIFTQLRKLPDMPESLWREERDTESPFSDVDHDDEGVRQIPEMVSDAGKEFYLTKEQVDELSDRHSGAYDAANVMVTERHGKSDLIRLVCACLLKKEEVDQQDRERFETMCTEELGLSTRRLITGDYVSFGAQCAWVGWQHKTKRSV